jgi:hypothetical protein
MPTQKDFKRLVRARMLKTGEAYTAARAHLLQRQSGKSTAGGRYGGTAVASAPASPSAPSDYARLAGIGDAALKAKTGCNWERWVWALDKVEAHSWPHRQIAQYVREKYKTPSWWTQMVTVGYERIKGLRAMGQLRGGEFNATKSRTFAVPLALLYRAFSDQRARKGWLPLDLTVRSKTRNKYVRITWPDRTSVEAVFTGKGAAKSQVQIQHGKFPDRAAAVRLKSFWAERLDVLGETLVQE